MKFSRPILSLILVAGLAALIIGCIDQNTRPVASFIADPTSGPSPLTVNFDGSGSYDPDGTIESYSWDFGDGTSGTGITATRTFSSSTDRTFSVKLTVTDNGGRTHSMSGFVVVYGSASGAVLFFDDFEDGFDPAWERTAGWEVDDGVLVHRSGSARAYLRIGTGWTNYIVEVDVEPRGEIVGLMLRCQEDLRSYVQFWGYSAWLRCKSYVDGEGGGLPDTGAIAPGFLEGKQHVRIVVTGSTYKIYINDLLRIAFADETYSSGMPGLYCAGNSSGENEARFDNFRVIALE